VWGAANRVASCRAKRIRLRSRPSGGIQRTSLTSAAHAVVGGEAEAFELVAAKPRAFLIRVQRTKKSEP